MSRIHPNLLTNLRKSVLVLLLAGCGPLACSTTTSRLGLGELPTVPNVDLERYQGTWYEIATIPKSFQKGCQATTATYKGREDGRIDVINRCRKDALDGPEDVAKGIARSVSPNNAKLKVSFFRPFWGDYWVIELGDAYQYAVVGHPSRDYLWILSRTPTMESELYAGILKRLNEKGYDTSRLVRTPQRP